VSGVTRLVLLRHGVTDWNERNVFQGQEDIPLNERGLAQASAVAPYLAGLQPTAIYCSPMVRTRQTAQPVIDLIGIEPTIDARLAEIDVGTWVGYNLADVSVLDPEAGRAQAAGKDFRRSPSGETMTEVGARVGECLRQVAQDHDGETVLIASHGGAIRMGIVNLLGWTYETAVGLGGLANCSVSNVSRRGSRWRLEVYNSSVVTAPGVVN